VCAYMYRHTHTCMYRHRYYLHDLRTYVRAYIHTYIHSFIHAYIDIYMHTYIHAYTHTHTRTHIHTHIHTHTLTHIMHLYVTARGRHIGGTEEAHVVLPRGDYSRPQSLQQRRARASLFLNPNP